MASSSLQRVHNIQSTFYPDGVYVFDNNDCVSSHALAGTEWESHICDTLAKYYKPGTDFVDIGANLGLNTLGLHKRNPITGTAHLFEPQHDVFTMMMYNTRVLPQRKLYNACLSDAPTVLAFEQVPTNIGGTHMVGKGGLEDDPTPTGNNAVSVGAMPLDAFKLFEGPPISLMKIDVEGSEESVLEGARRTITTHKPVIVIEVWQWKRAKVFDKLVDLGYTNMQHLGADDYLVM